MKKKLLTLLMVITLPFGVVACGSSKTEPAESATPATQKSATAETKDSTAGEKVHLTYALWGGEDEAKNTQKTIDKFNASQDRIEVECMPIPWETYMEKLNTMAAAGQLPDCAIMSEAGVIQWAEQGMLYDISKMYDGSEARPLDSLAFTYQGKPVAYSTAFESLLLYYNKDMFDKAGIPYPSANADEAWTWDEFVEVAKKLTLDKNGKTPNDPGFDKDNIVQYGCMIENLTWQLEVWCLSNGSGFYSEDGSKVIINDPAAIEALQKIADLYLVEHVAPLSSGLTDDGVQRSLIAGTCAMTTNGAWNIGTCLAAAREEGLNYGVGVLPYMKEKVTINTGGPNVVFSQTKHPEEAMEFLKWYALEENNWDALIATGIWMPTLDSYYKDETLTRKWLENPAYPEYEEAKGVLVDYAMEYAKPASWYYVNNTTDFNSLLSSVLGDVWTGKITAEKAINDCFVALEEAHAGNN
ncbi:ABC transporter substrate-binding protein [Sporanaerobium hydrogeniformans]|uniref:ABC transporter substrate-binding protein n=1 Tax=Sporanaerobium hydrogeniformans TaxID=3072179 RepID=A0AC61D8P6_9FIRM|nr:sugar ABC transporter substrate-binding protein [Sporanaerobium hydrogeniformans]PHV69629.1 ABC transporter substrate-binding protein [Sporanaerobium hydrogeniformans]